MIPASLRGLLLACATGILLAGCGAQRGTPPPLEGVADPSRFVPFEAPGGDVTLLVPENWTRTPRLPPGVVTIASGGAALTVWAYPTEAIVFDAASAERARRRLLASLRRRAPDFRVREARITSHVGSPAVEIEGVGTVGSRRVRVLALHVYKGAAEYVIDAYADPDAFERVSGRVFGLAIESIRFGGSPPSVEQQS